MTGRYSVNDLMKFNYSEIGEYIGEGSTDRPLRNDVLVKKLNNYVRMEEAINNEILCLDKKIKELNNVLDKTVRAGMGTSNLYAELKIYEDLRDKLNFILGLCESETGRIFEKIIEGV